MDKVGRVAAQRNVLWARLCNILWPIAWKTRNPPGQTVDKGWFVAGINTPRGTVTFALPDSLWEQVNVRDDNTFAGEAQNDEDVLYRIPSLDQVTPVPLPMTQLFAMLHRTMIELNELFPVEHVRHQVTYNQESNRLELAVWYDEANQKLATFTVDEILLAESDDLAAYVNIVLREYLAREEAEDNA